MRNTTHILQFISKSSLPRYSSHAKSSQENHDSSGNQKTVIEGQRQGMKKRQTQLRTKSN